MPDQTRSATRTRLRSGQTMHLYARAETSFIVTKGQARFAEAPLWLCDQFLQQSIRVRDGECYVVQSTGWILVEALDDAEIICNRSGHPSLHAPGRASIAVRLSRMWRAAIALDWK